ncbi:MAG: cupin domain-containing protein [Hyphomonadaceae bacterium]
MKSWKTLALACAASAALFAAPAYANECPADQVVAATQTGAPTQPSGVTDTVIASIDLGAGYGLPGRQLRMRRLVVQPGGVVPVHSHGERPANIYIVSGEITEYRSTCAAPITHRAGEVAVESGDLTHWWRNNSRRETVLISADLPPPEMANAGSN